MPRAVIAFVLLCSTAGGALAADKDDGFFAGLDVGQSRLEPRDNGGGYDVSDKSGTAWRALAGYRFSPEWSAEVWYIDAGEAGIRSDNPLVGELGTIEYKLFGFGAEWAPLMDGQERAFFPVLKAGVIQTSNRASSPLIDYERQHHTGVYFGAGGGWQFSRMWGARAEVVTYDKDELVMSLGVRASF
jgi:hypothetical protein